ncbi:MAG TPA: DNA repair protein RadC [Vicinamibacteria bacterium]|nr:DNA repair protein RadC [Vicinamibacteria bacterium]
MMKALDRPDRPREKLLESGPASLGANELLALVLGSGTRSSSALELANHVLDHAGGLEGLARLEPCDLAAFHGLKDARAARIVAALELGKRATSPPSWPRPRFRLPGEAARYLIPRFGTKPLEEFGILVLDTRNGLKRLHMVSSGSLNGSLVHPREVFREAAVSRAAAIIAFHNHPSGDPAPSREDHDLTRRLRQAGQILGIELLDHVVVAAGRYWSFKEHGEL